jgi:PAS domain S-box-containing protein
LAVDDIQLLEQLEAGIVVMDPAGLVVRWNEHAQQILGVSAQDAIGRPWSELLTVVGGEEIVGREVRAAAMKPGGWDGLTQLRVGLSGTTWVRAHVQAIKLSPTDLTPGVAAIFWPDTAPSSPEADAGAHARPHPRDARIGAIVVNQMTDAIVTTDHEQLVTAVNPAAEQLYGFRAEEALGRPVTEIIAQLGLDGTPIGPDWIKAIKSAGYWQGRVIHRPLIGSSAGRNIVVDLSTTILRDHDHSLAGMVGLSREVASTSHLDSDAVALAALAVAMSRARTRQEVANAVLQRLCEVTMADFGVIGTWAGDGNQQIEASHGLNEEVLQIVHSLSLPALSQALEQAVPIVAIETISEWLTGTETQGAMARNGIETGFLVSLRVRDDPIGFLALGSRRTSWMRPRDEVVLQMASQVANALENARLMERLEHGLDQERRLTAQLETLIGLTQLPQGNMSEEAIAQVLLERIIGALEADLGFVVRESDDCFQVVASRGLPDEMRLVAESRSAASFAFWRRLQAKDRGGAFHEHLRDIVDVGPEFDDMIAHGITAHAVFPVRAGEKLVGAFLCYFSGSVEEKDLVDDRNIEAVGRIISIAYANARMSEGLAEAAEHERRLRAELQAIQELTLLGASTDDLARLAEETIQQVVIATGATGGGYILIDPASSKVEPISWVGMPSPSWPQTDEPAQLPADWPAFGQLQASDGTWLSQSDGGAEGETRHHAQAVLPLRVDDHLAGVLHLEWSESPRSEQYDIHFLEPIARIASTSLANFRLRSELLHRAASQRALGHRLDTLDELTRIGEEASSFEELAHRTVSLVREALGASGVCYLLIEPGHHFETHAVAGETGAFRLWLKGVPAKDAPGGSLLLSGGGSVLGNFASSQVNERVLPLARATGFRSFGAIPIRTGEELAGALLCFFEQPAASLPLDEAALDSVARIAGIALANYRLRERLVSSEERYRTLFEESPDAFLVSALDGTVLDANEAAVRLYRVNRGEVLGRYFGQLISADEREMARRRQIVWAQGRGTFRDRGRRPDGSEFPVDVEVRVVELGGQRRFLHLVRDLSDQERLQRELLQAQKMEAIGQLVSGVAHELNNPLAAIIAFSQLMRSDERLPDDMKHDAGLLVQEADRTRRIVQNLLDFARARPPERRPTNITVLVQSVLELQSYALNTNQILVKVEIPASLPEVDLDRAQLQQVLLNLTINAIHAIRGRDRKSPAHLWIGASLVKQRASAGAAKSDRPTEDQARVRITIRDDGPGVPESARARLFDPFFTTKQPGEGTGLGLSVSFGIVAGHGGHLWYEPGPGGVGSSFVLELPVTARGMDDLGVGSATGPRDGQIDVRPAPKEAGSGQTTRRPAIRVAAPATAPAATQSATRLESAGQTAPASPASPTSGPIAPAAPVAATPAEPATAESETPQPRRPLVLALDDEPSIRAFLRKALAAAGMDCLPFQDGAQALDALRESNFDVMLVDHRMAGMSGTEFYEAAIAFRPELAERAIFMSGDVLNPDLRGFATQRGIRLLAKPFDIDAVIRIVRETIVAAEESGAAVEPASPPTPKPGRAKSPKKRRPHVLVLDDEQSIRTFLRKALAAAGMDCTPTQDGASALDALRDIPFDCMLVDHRMAGMSGTEFYEAAIVFRPEIAKRAIFMSGDVLNPDLRGFATQRGIRLLAKPFDIDKVIQVVRDTIEAGDAEAAAEPASPPPPAEDAEAAAEPASPPPPKRNRARPPKKRLPHILVLDDEQSIRTFLRKALAVAGMDCTPTQDGASALDALRDIPFDCMLVDHRMPGMSITEFYEAAISFRPELAERAIFMTNDVLNPDLRAFASQRGIRLLAKPFDFDTVIRLVRDTIAAGDEVEPANTRVTQVG